MSTISVSIPSDDEKALVAAATMLLIVAGKIPPINLDDSDKMETTVNVDRLTEGLDQPPAPPAPQQQTSQPPAPPAPQQQTSGVDLAKDSNGNMIPWDARIHSGAKTKNKDGSWKKKKGVSNEVISAVESELVSLMAVPAQQQTSQPPAPPAPQQQTSQPPAPPAPQQQTSQPPAPPAPQQQTSQPPAPPAPQQQTSQPPAPPAPQQQTAGTGPTNYAELLTQVSALIQSGKIAIEKVNEQVIANGVQSLQHLAMRPDLIPNVWQSIQGSLNG